MKYIKCFDNHQSYDELKNKSDYKEPLLCFCKDKQDVHFNEKYNNIKYVDMGLESGTLWAVKNVGSKNEVDYGLYFYWGDINGYTLLDSDLFDIRTHPYKWYNTNNLAILENENVIKYNNIDNKQILELTDDSAKHNMGKDWHMPVIEQFAELIYSDNITYEFIENYNNSDINGLLFTSLVNNNTLFFPASGYIYYNSFNIHDRNPKHLINEAVILQSSCVYNNSFNLNDKLNYLSFNYQNESENNLLLNNFRHEAVPVRGVIGDINIKLICTYSNPSKTVVKLFNYRDDLNIIATKLFKEIKINDNILDLNYLDNEEGFYEDDVNEEIIAEITLLGNVIPAEVFYECFDLIAVEFPHYLTTIQYAAFSYTNLTDITFPKSILYIDDNAFNSCENLINVNFTNYAPVVGLNSFTLNHDARKFFIPSEYIQSFNTNESFQEYKNDIIEV